MLIGMLIAIIVLTCLVSTLVVLAACMGAAKALRSTKLDEPANYLDPEMKTKTPSFSRSVKAIATRPRSQYFWMLDAANPRLKPEIKRSR